MVFITTIKLLSAIINHSEMARIRGFNPTFLMLEKDRLAPIRNNVMTSPFFAK